MVGLAWEQFGEVIAVSIYFDPLSCEQNIWSTLTNEKA